MKTILQDKKECYICKTRMNLHDHHIFMGSNRNNSEKYGLKVWLCFTHHNGSNYSPHFNRAVDLELKRLAESKFEETHTREEFIRIFGKSWL